MGFANVPLNARFQPGFDGGPFGGQRGVEHGVVKRAIAQASMRAQDAVTFESQALYRRA